MKTHWINGLRGVSLALALIAGIAAAADPSPARPIGPDPTPQLIERQGWLAKTIVDFHAMQWNSTRPDKAKLLVDEAVAQMEADLLLLRAANQAFSDSRAMQQTDTALRDIKQLAAAKVGKAGTPELERKLTAFVQQLQRIAQKSDRQTLAKSS